MTAPCQQIPPLNAVHWWSVWKKKTWISGKNYLIQIKKTYTSDPLCTSLRSHSLEISKSSMIEATDVPVKRSQPGCVVWTLFLLSPLTDVLQATHLKVPIGKNTEGTGKHRPTPHIITSLWKYDRHFRCASEKVTVCHLNFVLADPVNRCLAGHLSEGSHWKTSQGSSKMRAHIPVSFHLLTPLSLTH